MTPDFIIVGSGAAGAAAALALRGRSVLMLDAGKRSPEGRLAGPILSQRRAVPNMSGPLLGEELESLHNVFRPFLSPKLKAPLVRFVTEGAAEFCPVRSSGFDAQCSLALGGLANAWGAGVYRYTDEDLEGFPVRAGELTPHYAVIEREAGVSGAEDDLSASFGPAEGLLPPLELPRLFLALLDRYQRERNRVRSEGLTLGQARLAVLSRPYRGRLAYGYEALEFFQTGNPAVYSPAFTVAELIHDGGLEYVPGVLVQEFHESAGHVTIVARDLSGGHTRTFEGRHLLLAAGALGSARIVLSSRRDHDAALPILDNAVTYIPFLDLRSIGRGDDERVFPGAVLNGVLRHGEGIYQMSLYGMTGPLRSDFVFEFPLAARGCLAASRLLVPALVICQVFFADTPEVGNFIRLGEDGVLEISYSAKVTGVVERTLIRLFRHLGLLSLPLLIKPLMPGSSFHYAGCLPMRDRPDGPYETDRFGSLGSSERIHVVDAACFPRLPSKNHTLTIMANAHRIASVLSERVR